MASAATLCVNPSGGGGCYTKIQTAVNHASANDVINVKKGTYYEDVTIGIPLSLIGDGANQSVINADGLANAIFVDGLDHPGLHGVTIAGFTVENARYEAILLVSASDVTVRDTTMINNDKYGPIFNPATVNCVGQPSFETDESGDCGGALHLIGTSNSIVSGNLITGNADGILISDETAESAGNLITHNIVKNNPLECGIVLASHPPVGSSPPSYAPHFGVDNNTVADNISKDNGVQVGGAGVGLFSDGNGSGKVSGNVVIDNTLTGNGIGGVSLHTHVGPSFHLPADNFNGNHIIGNTIAHNLADTDDTATPGRVGININSGSGGSPVTGTVISGNNISDEDVDIAINTPALVDIHLNNLLGGKIGVADVCVFDGATACTGSIDAIQNYWGCDDGPGGKKCSTVSGADILYIPWLEQAVTDDPDNDQ
jgi:parallel beta-helix repeat protein